jgi:hypothetical protein
MTTFLIFPNATDGTLQTSSAATWNDALNGAATNRFSNPLSVNAIFLTTYLQNQFCIPFQIPSYSGEIRTCTLTLTFYTKNGPQSNDSVSLRYFTTTPNGTLADKKTSAQLIAAPIAGTITTQQWAGITGSVKIGVSLVNTSNLVAGTTRTIYGCSQVFVIDGQTPTTTQNDINAYASAQAGTIDDPVLRLTDSSGPSVVAVASDANTAFGNVNVPIPTPLNNNDILALSLVASDNVVSTMPAGWTLKHSVNNGTGMRGELWWKRSDGTDTGTVTVTRASGNACLARMVAIRGAITSGDPIEAVASQANASSATVTAPSLTTLTNGALVAFNALARAAVGDTSLSYTNAVSAFSGTNPTFFEEYESAEESRPIRVGLFAGNNAAGATTLSFTMPSSASAGDLVVCWVTVRGTTTTVTRTSPVWTLHDSLSDGSTAITRLLWYVIPSSGGDQANGTVTFTLGSSQKASCAGVVVRNANTTTPFNQSVSAAIAAQSTGTTPGFTASSANTLRMNYAGVATGSTITHQGGDFQTIIVQSSSTGGSAATRTTSAVGEASDRPVSGVAEIGASFNFGATARSVLWATAIAPANQNSASLFSAGGFDNRMTAGAITGRTATLTTAALNIGLLYAVKPPAGGTNTQQSVASSLTAATAIADRTDRLVASAITSAAASFEKTGRLVVAALTPASAITAVRAALLTISASLLPASAVTAAGAALRAVAASLSSTTALARSAQSRFTATVTANTSVVERAAKALSSAIAATAQIARAVSFRRAVSASITVSSALSVVRTFLRNVAASISATALVARNGQRRVASSIALLASVKSATARALVAVLNPAAQIARLASFAKTLFASVQSTASVAAIKAALRLLVSSITASASVLGIAAKLRSLFASISSTALIGKSIQRSIAASVTAAAAVARRIPARLLASALVAASLVERVAKTASASLVAAASVSAIKSVLRSLASSLTASAAVLGISAKTRSVSAAVSASAFVVESIRRSLAASIAASAQVARLSSFAKTASASLAATASAVAIKAALRSLTSSLTASAVVLGVSAKLRSLSASVTASSSLVESIRRSLAAAVTATSALTRRLSARVAASATFSANLAERAAKRLVSSLAATASVAKRIATLEAAAATVSAVVSRVQSLRRTFQAILTPATSLAVAQAVINKAVAASLSATANARAAAAKRVSAVVVSAAAKTRSVGKRAAALLTSAAATLKTQGTRRAASIAAQANAFKQKTSSFVVSATAIAFANATATASKGLASAIAVSSEITKTVRRVVAASVSLFASRVAALVPLIPIGPGYIRAAIVWVSRIASQVSAVSRIQGNTVQKTKIDADVTTKPNLSNECD